MKCPACGVNDLGKSAYPGFPVLVCLPCAERWLQAHIKDKR